MSFWDFLFPKFCLGCNKFGTYLCKSCVLSILQAELICPECKRPSIGGATHPLCQRRYGLNGLWSLGVYEGVLQKVIKTLKYRYVSDLAETLINLTVEYWARHTPFFIEVMKKGIGEWVIVPVPLHPKRQNFRGFNQSALLGRILSQKLSLEYREPLQRIKNTKSQVGLKSTDRKKNIKGAFALNTRYTIHNTNILLIDDVWTTGSTLKECCYVLKKGGARKVWAITLAR